MNWRASTVEPVDAEGLSELKLSIPDGRKATNKVKERFAASKEAAAVALDALGGKGTVTVAGYASPDGSGDPVVSAIHVHVVAVVG